MMMDRSRYHPQRSARAVVGSGGAGDCSATTTTVAAGAATAAAAAASAEPSVWAARNVEWPLPSALSINQYQKLLKQSKEAGSALGIVETAPADADDRYASSGTAASGGGGGAAAAAAAAGDGNIDDKNNADSSAGAEAGYFSGFMSRVLNTSQNANDTSCEDDVLPNTNHHSSSSSSSSQRPLRPPRSGCVATANSWMVATLECPAPPSPSSLSSSKRISTDATVGGGAGSSSLQHDHLALSSSLTAASSTSVLRLVSRWNVRRMSGVDHWMALPPPVAGGDGRIAHVFMDPTGCHTLLSAKNGEAYYHHSSLRAIKKLAGFGRKPDGTWASSKELNGIAATSPQARNISSGSAAPLLQQGLSIGSYVTAVAWDRERGTEGSTKKILLGTNQGEIYEYMLLSPNASSSGTTTTTNNNTAAAAGAAATTTIGATGAAGSSTPGGTSTGTLTPSKKKTKSGTTSGGAGDDSEQILTVPVLLHQLSSDAPVTGLLFERLRTGLLVLCCTSGKHKRTRFYTFYSAHSSSFRMVMADEAHASLVELPGSIDHADLRLCNDQVLVRTETGIYYGTVDRAQSGPAFAGGSMMVDSGILSYDDIFVGGGGRRSGGGGGGGIGSIVPVSVALTPHHIVTLSENNELRFINRVAQKVIQKERVEFVSGGDKGGGIDESFMGLGELMSDVRRPDQVWLRKARSLVHISSSQEDRDVWKFTLYKSLAMTTGPSASSGRHLSSSSSSQWGGTAGGTSSTALSEEEKAQEILFEDAKRLCTNPSQKAVVTAVRGEYHLSQGRAELAAKYLAQCPPVLEPFADTSVRLALTTLGIDDPRSYGGSLLARDALKSNIPLITYLSDKMRVAKNNNDRMTCTMIGAWLTELYLHERDSSPAAKQALTQFLSHNVHTMEAKTIMKILTSHDVSASDCAAYAAVSGDISTAVNAALRVAPDSQDGVVEALRILNEAPFELAESLYYKYASVLLARAPVLAGKSFLSRYTHGLSPTRFLPSFMHYERLRSERKRAKQVAQAARGKNPFAPPAKEGVEEQKTVESVDAAGSDFFGNGGVEVQIMPGVTQAKNFVDDPTVSAKYLEGVIKLGCRSSAVYTLLVSLFVQMSDEEPLFNFLSTHVPSAVVAADASRKAGLGAFANEGVAGPLDMSYALRAILTSGRHYRSAIRVYMGFGMRQQAVELALKVDPSLARELAQDSVELEERKRLWLMIAKNAASEGVSGGDVDVVSKVVSVLKACGPDVLSIEDVLPFLPDFAQIDQIKEEICEALTSYSAKIESFLKEMNDCDHRCDELRGEISRLRTHRMELRSDARCAFTNKIVLKVGEPFYVFPSGYVVLQSALKKAVLPYLNEKQQERVEEIQKLLLLNPAGLPTDQSPDSLQAELDGLIAAECPLTGSIMVESIDEPFDDSDEIAEGLDPSRTTSVAV